uniref:Uncharacterized protein n=1 Tax=Polytomella parva TaxID=51329 RepID=A0A7S0ULS0_9CHLO|mmetsp:Transcript_10138/g.18770  ORF Transcript_10138/g.18770 Transcript_10138/m.18770 type:complete len:609 (+) Transcript_10138:37-1863(+)
MALIDDDTLSDIYGSEVDSEDIAQAVAIINHFKGENATLRGNFNTLKKEYICLDNNNKKLQSKYDALIEEKKSMEKQYQSVCQSWKVELDEKTKQFEEAKAQILAPRDIELLKIKLMEDIEGPYKSKITTLEEELSVARKTQLKEKRAHDQLKNEIQTLELRQRQKDEQSRIDHHGMESEARDRTKKIAELEAKCAAAEAALRTAHRDIESLRYKVSSMLVEIEDIRRQRAEAISEGERAAAAAEREKNELAAAAAELAASRDAAERRHRLTVTERDEAAAAASRAHKHALDTQTRLSESERRLAALQREFDAQTRSVTESSVSEMTRLRRRTEEVEDQLRMAVAEAVETKLKSAAATRETETALEKKVAALRKELTEKERSMMEKTDEAVEKAETRAHQAEASRHEMELRLATLRAESELAAREMAAAAVQLDEIQRRELAARTEAAAAKEELLELRGALVKMDLNLEVSRQRQAELSAKVEEEERRRRPLEEACEMMRQQMEAASSALTMERANAEKAAADLCQVAAGEKKALVKQMKAATKELMTRCAAENAKYKRRLRKARDAVMAAHEEAALARLSHLDEQTLLADLTAATAAVSVTKPAITS